jgi:hypothetical protein
MRLLTVLSTAAASAVGREGIQCVARNALTVSFTALTLVTATTADCSTVSKAGRWCDRCSGGGSDSGLGKVTSQTASFAEITLANGCDSGWAMIRRSR